MSGCASSVAALAGPQDPSPLAIDDPQGPQQEARHARKAHELCDSAQPYAPGFGARPGRCAGRRWAGRGSGWTERQLDVLCRISTLARTLRQTRRKLSNCGCSFPAQPAAELSTGAFSKRAIDDPGILGLEHPCLQVPLLSSATAALRPWDELQVARSHEPLGFPIS